MHGNLNKLEKYEGEINKLISLDKAGECELERPVIGYVTFTN